MKLVFQLRRCIIDAYSGFSVESVTVLLYDWRTKARSKFVLKNAALIHKVVRICSLSSPDLVASEIQQLLIQPHAHNMPFGYKSPKSIKDKLAVNNSYFTEKLMTFLIKKQLTLNGFRFGKTIIKGQPAFNRERIDSDAGNGNKRFEVRKNRDEIVYTKYSGTISGLAKIQEHYPDYYQLNQLDLNVMSQEQLKYRLITGGLDSDNSIKRMCNVRFLEYMLRRDIIGLGKCDIKLEVYLSQYTAANATTRNQMSFPGDQTITASSFENFYSIVSNRIIEILKLELARMGMMDSKRDLISEYSNFLNQKHRFIDQQNKEIETKAPLGISYSRSKRVLTEQQIWRSDIDGSAQPEPPAVSFGGSNFFANLLAGVPATPPPEEPVSPEPNLLSLFGGNLNLGSATNNTQPEPASPPKVTKVFGTSRFFRKFVEIHRRLGQSKQLLTQKLTTPKLFHEHETIMFLLRVAPVGNRISTHKMILSSADIVNFFDIGDFFMETLQKKFLDMETISWIGSLEPKVVFNHLCNYICSKLIMRRWVTYSRLFLYSLKNAEVKEPLFYQNDFMLMYVKTTPKIQNFLRIQTLDYESVYHRVMKLENRGFALLSVVKRNREQMVGVKLYIQRNCRTYYANLHNSDLRATVEEFIKKVVMHLLIVTQATKLKTFNDLLNSFTRDPVSQDLSPSDKFLEILGLDKYKFMEFFKYKLGQQRPEEEPAAAPEVVKGPVPTLSLKIPGFPSAEDADHDEEDEPPSRTYTSRYSRPRNPTTIFSKEFSKRVVTQPKLSIIRHSKKMTASRDSCHSSCLRQTPCRVST